MTPAFPPITVHRSPGKPLRVEFAPPEDSPIREVRELAAKAEHLEAAAANAGQAYEAGDFPRVLELTGGDDGTRYRDAGDWYLPIDYVGAPPTVSDVDAYIAAARPHHEAKELLGEAHEVERRFLLAALAPKVKVRETSAGVYELPKSVDVFALVAALKGSGLAEVRVLSDFVGVTTSRSCTGSCRTAKLADCRCACGGMNHGVSIPGWKVLSSTEVSDPANPDAVLIRREYEAGPQGPPVATRGR